MQIAKKIFNRLRGKTRSFINLLDCDELASKKITVIQMPIINICNSRCTMCNVWKNKHDNKISASAYSTILSNKLFKDVEYVGVNGGEPTLHPELFEIIKTLTKKLPKLKGVNIITNGINQKRIYEVIKDIHRLLQEKKVSFNVGISLDGDQVHHDKNRGIPGNYRAATTLLQRLLDENITTWVGCTLTKKNLYCGDDIELFAKKHKLGHFEIRMGVDIERLNNKGFFASQTYSNDERFHLSQLFQKLHHQNPSNLFYKSLFNQLTYNKRRTAGCSWRHNGITLDAEGSLSFCSVASPIIGNCLKRDANNLYKENQRIRNEIKKSKCANCMHDLDGPSPFKVKIKNKISFLKKSLLDRQLNRAIKEFKQPTVSIQKNDAKLLHAKNILITGWYGTETHGDKAILGELFNFLNDKCPNLEKIYITSFPEMEYVVSKTITELEETKICNTKKYAGTIPITNFSSHKTFDTIDFVFLGGGPIERIPELYYIERGFKKAYRKNKGTFLFGCGIDPVLREFKPIVKSLLLHTHYAFFRDKESLQRAKTLTNKKINAFYACDPALNFVQKWNNTFDKKLHKKQFELCTLVRENTAEYLVDVSQNKIATQNKKSAQTIGTFLSAMQDPTTQLSALLSMNNLWIGGDDRIYNRKILASTTPENHPEYFEHKYMGLHELLEKISQSKTSLVTRYHGHLFSLALNIPFISIDYTGKGNKVENFLNRTNLTDLSIKWNELSPEKLLEQKRFIDQNSQKIKAKLSEELHNLTTLLGKTYEKFD